MNESANSAAVPVLQGVRVLVVEDDALLLMELESILVDAGAEVIGACRSVADALAVAHRESVAAAVLDVRIGRLYRAGRQRSGNCGMAGSSHRREAGAGENDRVRRGGAVTAGPR
jgi:ActR/RegA family two-component response regulator